MKAKSKKEVPVQVPVQEPVQKMCELPVENLKAVCDWLNSDNMLMPQNEVRKALAMLMVANVTN